MKNTHSQKTNSAKSINAESCLKIASGIFDPEVSRTHDYARMYRSNCLQVVPAKLPSSGDGWKRPAISWKPYEKELVGNHQFDNWYGPKGTYINHINLGMVTGSASSGVFVVDVDSHKNKQALQWLDGLKAVHNNNIDFQTPTQRTGGGGLQLLFRAPKEWSPPTFTTAIGIDIRGQGGFAMLPPSLHESGKHYVWLDGMGPWELPILEAPVWLCEAIDDLRAKHGSKSSISAGQQDASITKKVNESGRLTDGREDRMTKFIWGRLVGLWRDCPIPMPNDESEKRLLEAFDQYSRDVAPKNNEAGISNNDLLEREGRGITEFRKKWHRAISQWDTKIRDDAQNSAGGSSENNSRNLVKDNTDPWGDVSQFRLDRFTQGKPKKQDYLLEPIFPRGVVSIIFGPGGVGKSLIALDLGLSIATRTQKSSGNLNFASGPLGGIIPADAGGAVVFITLEDSNDELHRRIEAMDPDGRRKNAPFYVLSGCELLDFDPTLVEADHKKSQFTEFAKNGLGSLLNKVALDSRQPIRLLVLDPAGDFINADENDATFVKPLMRRLARISRDYGCTTILLGHTAKGVQDREGGSMRGSSAWIANSRAAYSVWRPEIKQAAELAKNHRVGEAAIVFGNLVKANHAGAPIGKTTQFYRHELTGRLIPLGPAGKIEGPSEQELLKLLVDAVAECAAAGAPFTHTGNSGLYENRSDLPGSLSNLSKERLNALGTKALADGLLVKAKTGGGSAPPKFLDVPDGPLSTGAQVNQTKGSRQDILQKHRKRLQEAAAPAADAACPEAAE